MSEASGLSEQAVSDLEVLRALAAHAGGGPVFDAELAGRVALPQHQVTVRLLSLVSLGYVEQLRERSAEGGYTITDQGRRAVTAATGAGDDRSPP
jgi:DNA-binding IclR family transcriptional regulator